MLLSLWQPSVVGDAAFVDAGVDEVDRLAVDAGKTALICTPCGMRAPVGDKVDRRGAILAPSSVRVTSFLGAPLLQLEIDERRGRKNGEVFGFADKEGAGRSSK